MYKIIPLVIYAAFCWLSPCLAQSLGAAGDSKRLELTVTSTYQQSDFDWSIAGNVNSESPNVLSELVWKKLRGPAITLHAKSKPYKTFYLEASYSHSFILSGSASDTDYSEDNRNSPVFNAALQSDHGHLRYFKMGPGWRLVQLRNFNLLSSLGYALSTQKLNLTDNNPGSNLNSWYKSKWKGPYLKMESDVTISQKFRIEVAATYHQVKYEAVADWNTIEEFQHPISFRHRAKGYGLGMEARVIRRLGRDVDLFFTGNLSKWKTGAGVDEVFLANGTSGFTRLNSVNYSSAVVGIGLGFKL